MTACLRIGCAKLATTAVAVIIPVDDLRLPVVLGLSLCDEHFEAATAQEMLVPEVRAIVEKLVAEHGEADFDHARLGRVSLDDPTYLRVAPRPQ